MFSSRPFAATTFASTGNDETFVLVTGNSSTISIGDVTITGVKREIEVIKTNHLAHLDEKISHVHEDVEKLGGKIDRIYWVVVSTVGAVGLMFIETLLGMI